MSRPMVTVPLPGLPLALLPQPIIPVTFTPRTPPRFQGMEPIFYDRACKIERILPSQDASPGQLLTPDSNGTTTDLRNPAISPLNCKPTLRENISFPQEHQSRLLSRKSCKSMSNLRLWSYLPVRYRAFSTPTELAAHFFSGQ
jgi:hypothetical protein